MEEENSGTKGLITALHKKGDWKTVLQIYEDGFWDCNLLWFRPDLDAVNLFKRISQSLKLKGIYSIGCGTGLFEWLLHHSTGLPVLGYEIDQGWWDSKYSPPKFWTDVICIDPKGLPTFEPSFALLFCYFNNIAAFEHYLGGFTGNCVILVGPDETEKERYCDPLPYYLRGHPKWRIHSSWQSRWRDAIVIYEKI